MRFLIKNALKNLIFFNKVLIYTCCNFLSIFRLIEYLQEAHTMAARKQSAVNPVAGLEQQLAALKTQLAKARAAQAARGIDGEHPAAQRARRRIVPGPNNRRRRRRRLDGAV